MMVEHAVVRDAREGDAEGIARVHVDAWRETYAGLVPDRFFGEAAFEQRREMWTRYLAMDPSPGPLAVAIAKDQIIGFANAGSARGPDAEKGHPPARDLHLYAIYVLAAAHGTGVGRALVEATLGEQPAQLWVAADNERAIAFYRRHGFEADGVEVADPDLEQLVEVRMVR